MLVLNDEQEKYFRDFILNEDILFQIENDVTHCEDGAESFLNAIQKKQKKVTNKMLAEYLKVSEQAVKQYPKNKNELMKFGLIIKSTI